MSRIEEILKLPMEEQIAILEAIQENLDDEQKEITLNEEQITYITERINEIRSSDAPTYSWQDVKQQLKDRWNTR
jgi:putative addiction module component (TIGR02574 family)